MDKIYTLPELARAAGVSESSARRYVKDFTDFLPTVDGGRFKKYKADCIQILQTIKSSYDAGQDREAILRELSGQYAQTIHQTPPQAPQEQSGPDMATRELLFELVSLLRDNKPMQAIEQHRPGHDDLNYIFERLDAIEKRLDEIEGKRAWFKKIFK